jgi:cytochrome P450
MLSSMASVVPTAPPPPVGWFGVNPEDPTLRNNPYPAWNRLRETQPVTETPHGYYRVLRHADVNTILRDTAVGVRTTDGVLPGVDESVMPRRFMLMQDPPNHTRLRRLVSRAFTPPAIEKLRPQVTRLVNELLDAAADGKGEIDVVQQLAQPLPSTVICEMLGVPLSDRASFTDWTAHVTHLLVPRSMSEATRKRAEAAAIGLIGYMSKLIEERKKAPSDDMLSALIRAEESGEQLTHEELITQSIGLLVAGFETTIGLIGNGVRQLLLHPDQLARLRSDPSLIERAVEECLRFDGPIGATRRVLHEDVMIGGYLLPKNAEVLLVIASAHRDPRVFSEPDRFDIGREQRSNLAFGGGIHFCLGAHLARMEAQIAIGELVRRFDKLELVSETPQWGESLFRIQNQLRVRV